MLNFLQKRKKSKVRFIPLSRANNSASASTKKLSA